MTAEQPIATWVPDCMGKQDYDADLVRLSCRLYPRDDFNLQVDAEAGTIKKQHHFAVKSSAIVSLMFMDLYVAHKSFEADTEEEVKALVEAWAREQYETVRKAMLTAFKLEAFSPWSLKMLDE